MRRTDSGTLRHEHDGHRPAMSSRRIFVMAVAAVTAMAAAALAATPATAQVAWEGPRLVDTTSRRGFGAHWVDYGTMPGDGMGMLFTWMGAGLPDRTQLRGGVAEGAYGAGSVFGGIDRWGRLASRSATLPVDLSWTTGIGAGVGEYAVVTVPLGVTAGRSWPVGSLMLSPYVHTGVGVDVRFGERNPGERWGMGVAIDLGFLLSLDRTRRYAFSASAGLGDRQAVSLGIVVR